MKNFKGTRQLLENKINHISGRTLDFGARRGKYKTLLSSASAEYVALDMFPNPNVDIVGDLHNTNLPENSFDTVVCTQVLEHVNQPFDVVKEIYRLLKLGGVCILTAPFMHPHHADPVDNYRFTKEGLENIFSTNNF